MKIYLSGGIAYDPQHRDLFEESKEFIARKGHEVIDPRRVVACGEEPCIDDSNGQMNKGHSWRCYMKYDLTAMLHCDAVFMLAGWEASHGARLEHHVAVSCGIPIIRNYRDLP